MQQCFNIVQTGKFSPHCVPDILLLRFVLIVWSFDDNKIGLYHKFETSEHHRDYLAIGLHSRHK